MLQLESAPLDQRSTRTQNRPDRSIQGSSLRDYEVWVGCTGELCGRFGERKFGFAQPAEHPSGAHFLELNEIYLALKRTKRLKRWKSERELISLNYVIGMPLAKDYDAIAEVEINGDSLRLAIEYERTLE